LFKKPWTEYREILGERMRKILQEQVGESTTGPPIKEGMGKPGGKVTKGKGRIG